MSQPDEAPQGDPWHAFGYIVSGVAIYGFVGWLLDRWLGTSFLVAIGILIGSGLGIFLTLKRFRPFDTAPTATRPPQPERSASEPRTHEN